MVGNRTSTPVRDLTRRIRRRIQRELLQRVGVRMRDVVFVTAENARDIAAQYQGVQVSTLLERASDTTLMSKCLPGDELEGIEPFRVELESTLFDIENQEFSLRNNVVIDPFRRVLFPAVTTREAVLMFNGSAPRRVRHLRGTVAYLSNTWVDNYYHWLQLTLPFVRLYREMKPDVEIDYYYVGNGEAAIRRVQVETLARLGIQPEQLVSEGCVADRVLALFCRRPVQHFGFNYRDIFGHEFARSLFPSSVGVSVDRAPSPRRIYVERGQTRVRRIVNEAEVISLLSEYGFAPVRMDGMSVAAQANLFANAEAIIGVHGAALTNLLFAQPGTRVIEIFPHEMHEPGMFTAATYSKVDYYHLRAQQLDPARDARLVRSQHLRIDVNKLEQLLGMANLTPVQRF